MSTTVLPRPKRPEPVRGRPHAAAAGGISRLRDWLPGHEGLLALGVYLAISLLWYRGAVAHMGSNCACGVSADPGDNADFLWWFEWFVHALGHGLPLLHPTAIWTPTGLNMAGTTASLLLGAIGAPLTLVWGPLVAYNVVMILAPAVSAWGAYRLCRYISGSFPAALIGGATYGFSSIELAQLVGHIQMVVMCCPPLVVLCAIRCLDGTWSRRRYLISMSLLLIVQILLSLEVAFTMTLAGAIALAATWLTSTPTQRRALCRRLPRLALPWLIAGVATAWYTLQVLGAPSYATGVASMYPTDLLSFFLPLPYTWIGGARLSGITSHFAGDWTETGAYLGWPLMLIVGRYLVTRRRTRTAQVLAITIVLLALWILGPVLYVYGRPVARLPYSLIASLPLLNEAAVGRLAVFLALAAAVALSLWIASPRSSRMAGICCGILAVVALLPNLASTSSYNLGHWTNPAFFRTSMYKRYIKPGQSVLPIVWGYQSQSYMWQAEDRMYWNLASGYWAFRPPPGWQTAVTLDLWLNRPRSGDGPLLRALLVQRDVSDVVVQDRYVPLWRRTLREAGLHATAETGGVSVYRVPRAWLADPARYAKVRTPESGWPAGAVSTA